MTPPELYDLNSAAGIRQIVTALFMGYNYRLYTEGQTRHDLLDAYLRLLEIHRHLPEGSGEEEWMAAVRAEMEKADHDLSFWLLGLTNKTAQNLGVAKTTRIDSLREVTRHIRQFTQENPQLSFDDAMLMLWAGASTLTVRGSRKSTAGKTLEQAFARAGLTLLGLREDADFWLNMQRDAEASREIDVEIASRRGRIKLEIGLIGRGNQEVIEDKINRVGPGGIVIFDQIGARSNAWQTARNQQVSLIQIRNNRPLSELYALLRERVDGDLIAPPSDAADLTAGGQQFARRFVPSRFAASLVATTKQAAKAKSFSPNARVRRALRACAHWNAPFSPRQTLSERQASGGAGAQSNSSAALSAKGWLLCVSPSPWALARRRLRPLRRGFGLSGEISSWEMTG